MPRAPILAAAFAVCVAVVLPACQQRDTGADADSAAHYQVEVIRSDYGVAHITADDFGSLGYGEGYATAEDHVCNISRALVQARGELARYFGAGEDNEHLASDVAVRAMDIHSQAVAALRQQDADNLAWLRGYADGYNRYLASKNGNRAGSWCDGEPWLQAITDLDLMARMVLLAQTLPRMGAALLAAQPPAAGADATAAIVSPRQLAAAADAAALEGMGSNAWALGGERTENGRGLLLGNPHYPWYGDNRFWEKQLTIPGKLDVYGVHLLGAPGVAIGFNRQLGWSHTVSDSQRVVYYALELVPGKPTTYVYDGREQEMTAVTVTVPVRQANGALEDQQHTLYFSHYGPVLTLPGMPWSETTAYTARDANVGNAHLLSQWKAMNLADDVEAFIDAHRQWNAMPWVNTIAASADGRALYIDNSSVGNLSDEAISLWRQRLEQDPLTAQLYQQRGFVLLDGSDSRYQWVEDQAAMLPGAVPFGQRPLLERRDYVFNANDSYWLSNPRQPLTGYSPLYGPENTARSLRTRMNARLLAPDSPYGYAGEDGKFSIEEVQRALFGNDSLAAALLRDALAQACAGVAEVEAACAAIAAFDGHYNEDSAGAVLFREWITSYDYADGLRAGPLFAAPFDPGAPLSTPHTLADSELAVQNLARAAAILEAAGLPLSATLGEAQFAYRGSERIPLHGGNRFEGVANLMVSGDPGHPIASIDAEPVADSELLTRAGYPVIHGSSFILALGFDDDGPRAEALLTYSQSGDPDSEHFSDQTRLYRNKQWRPVLFEREAVEANARSRIELVAPRR
ncbi:penicillin acylase family protein [Kineobactrum salinum]|uniref:Acylase n=1 Tax=Kineobactrum salinum TaxID=2708301 RepID=A0A6C0U6J4_9GAMM|nr:penicillin acylase family protein [Kineobactrum salinum]QIB66969.1 acylase [Kineobactrum salinum]